MAATAVALSMGECGVNYKGPTLNTLNNTETIYHGGVWKWSRKHSREFCSTRHEEDAEERAWRQAGPSPVVVETEGAGGGRGGGLEDRQQG